MYNDPGGAAFELLALSSPSALTRQAIAALCGDDDTLAGLVAGYGTFVLGGLAAPTLGQYARAGGVLNTVVDDARLLPIADDMVPCVNSFSADTPVATAAGTTPIGDIRVGDVVRGYDETIGTTGSFTVTAVISHTDLLVLDLTLDNETLTTTPEHPFYAMLRGWTDAEDLHSGDSVRRLDGTYGRVNENTVVHEPQVMYNLTVATAHTFFVGDDDWLVHNTNCVFTTKKLQHTWSHSKDFGVTGNSNKLTRQQFAQAIQDHVDTAPVQIKGTFRTNTPTDHYYNPENQLLVGLNPVTQELIAAWKLGPNQIDDLYRNGNVR